MTHINLKKSLSFFDILCIGVNCVVGSGIFLFPGSLAALLGPASVFAFLICGVLMIPMALCFASCASRYETTGGPYLYARDAFGPWAGFAVGWMSWVMLIFSYAAVANAIGVYLAYFWPFFENPIVIKAIAGSVIILWGLLNLIGVKPAARTADFFTIAKLLPLILFIGIGAFFVKKTNLTPIAPNGFAGLGPAIFLAFFAFQGFENAPVPSGESKNPKRDVPLAVIGALLLASVLYFGVQLVAVGTYADLGRATKPLAEAASYFLGPWAAALIALGAVISTTGYTTSAALVCPRYLYALSQDGYLPSALSQTHERFLTPKNAIVVTTAVVFLAAIFLDFRRLVDMTNVTVAIQYGATALAALVFNRKATSAGAWKLPGGALVPLAALGAIIYLTSQAARGEILAAGAVLLLGFLVAVSFKKSGRVS